MASTTIHDFPIELLQAVFVFACADGGATGHALSLVSRAFHAAVQPFRYYTLHLAGPAQITAFAAQHAADGPAYPKVRHLFLGARPPSAHTQHGDLEACSSNPRGDRARVARTIRALLARLGPDLRTLVVLSPVPHAELFAACPEFTELRDLTVARCDDDESGDGDGDGDEGAEAAPALRARLFPRLARLHLATCGRELPLARGAGAPEHLLSCWTALAPDVRELRLSDVPDRTAAVGLRAVLAKTPGESEGTAFPHMTRLWLQPFALSEVEFFREKVTTRRWELISALIELGKGCRKETSVLLLHPEIVLGTSCRDLDAELYPAWRAGVVGHEGYWKGGVQVRDMLTFARRR
ncbi:uncharacterized protein BXZ73DRAFT_73461 [Epithele typhae]|uniref:uncharacterized protein n=1 Tax=Epithele typhae TaxID=378194 RepID=UPI0020086068|nr:uncharacterized protein BXZ73DRAFT_73461 [Epithele typhae]KAH9945303.1 hypothetical protein BXZ73DRAFT_73461 [Epithele typhae]